MICERCGYDHQYPNDITIACELLQKNNDPIGSAIGLINDLIQMDQIAIGGGRALIFFLLEAKKRELNKKT